MRKPTLIGTTMTVLLTLLLGISNSRAQSERLELDWIFSDQGKAATAVPKHTWIDDNLLILYDEGVLPKSERTLEVYSASNGRRTTLVDAKSIVAELTELLQPDDPYTELGWPNAFGPNGHWALYEKSGDLILLDLRNSSVSVIARTADDESAGQFSPNGELIAFVRSNNIHVWDIKTQEETQLTDDGTDTLLNGVASWVYWEEFLNRAERAYAWAPDSSAIAFLQSDESGVGEMHYVDFEPYLPRLIKQRHPKPGEANPRVRAGSVRLDNAETTWIDLGAYPYEYLPRIQWLPDSRRLAVQTMNRPQTKLDIFLADAGSGEAQHLMRETNDAWVNTHDDLYFLRDSAQIIWQSERSGYAHLYMFNMQGKVTQQITTGDWALRRSGGTPGWDRSVSFVDEENEQIYFTALAKATTERHLYRIGFDGRDMQRVSEADGVHAIRFSKNGRFYADVSSALDRPPSLSVHGLKNDRSQLLADVSSATLDEFALQNWELFSIKARDGFEMPAMLLKPRFFDPEKQYPVVTYVYGGPSAPTVVNSWQSRTRGLYHQMLADSGVIVFLVDNRSAAGKSKHDANTIVEQLYGPVELNDLLDGISWLKAQNFVDADRVGIWGWSGGGSMTLQAMTDSGEFAAGAAIAPVTDWRYYDTVYTERYMKRPQDNEDGYAAASNTARAADIQGRLMLVHGTYDDNVHPQNSWAFSDGMIEAGITFDMMIYPMRKHGISDDAAQLHVFKSMFEFWQRNFGLND